MAAILIIIIVIIFWGPRDGALRKTGGSGCSRVPRPLSPITIHLDLLRSVKTIPFIANPTSARMPVHRLALTWVVYKRLNLVRKAAQQNRAELVQNKSLRRTFRCRAPGLHGQAWTGSISTGSPAGGLPNWKFRGGPNNLCFNKPSRRS